MTSRGYLQLRNKTFKSLRLFSIVSLSDVDTIMFFCKNVRDVVFDVLRVMTIIAEIVMGVCCFVVNICQNVSIFCGDDF